MNHELIPDSKYQSRYGEEKVSGTKTSTVTASRYLVIGGPAEGKLFEDLGYNLYRYPEIKPMTFTAIPGDTLPLAEPNYIEHVYRLETLGMNDEKSRPHYQKIYLHSSLTPEQGMDRLKDFLVRQFIMLEM
jgi:hypothetical protein